MKHSKRILAALMALALTASFAACSNDSGGAASPSAPASASESAAASTEGRSLIVAQLTADEAIMARRTKYIQDPMQAAFPDVEFTHEIFVDRQSVQVQVAAGGGPDILDLDGPTDAVEFAKASRIIPLDSYAEKYGWKDIFYDWAYQTSMYNGKLVSLPNSFEGMVIYYNKDVFEANGWTYPTNLDEMVKIMDDAQSKSIIPISFGNSNYQGAVDWLYSTFMSCYPGPAELKSALEGKTKINEGNILASIQMMTDWWQKGYIGDKKSQAISTDDLLSLFASGKAAMMIDGTWAATELLNTYPDCVWEADVMPEMRDGVGRIIPLATGGVYVINANSKQQDLAAEVLNWMFTSTDRHHESVAQAFFQAYPIKAFDSTKLEGMDTRIVGMYEDLAEAQLSGNVGYCAWTFFPSDARVYMNENTDNMFLGTLTPAEYLTEVQRFVDAGIAEGTSPLLP